MTSDLEKHLVRQQTDGANFFWHRLRWNAVKRHFPKDTPFKVLDVGAGMGFVGEYLQREYPGAEYYFSEPIPSLREILRARFGAERDLFGADRFPPVDVITLLDVLEHQEDDTAFFRRLIDNLAPGSKLILTVPALNAFWSKWDENLGHYRRYSKSMLRELVQMVNVETLALEYLFTELVPAALFRRWAGSGETDECVEFPEINPHLNSLLYRMGRITQSVSGLMPVGTSLILVVRKPL